MPQETWQPDERQLFDALDQYVAAIQTGDVSLRARLLAQEPRLAEMLDCLDTLETMAPERSDVKLASNHGTAPTVVLGGGTDKPTAPPQRPEHEFPPRAEFGNYELLAEAGRGGMGVVYKARQKDLDRIVALKMILSSRLASPDEVRRFQQEARAAGSLRHSHIVAIHEVGQVHGQHYFTMDFIEGSSLAAAVQAGPIEPDRAAKCLAAIARAVEYLHTHHLVHRDLKPSNILLDEHDQPYVTDFGLAKVFAADSQRTETGTIMGTASYMAPEQARGLSSQICAATDVYSLGAILYEMLTGRPPFQEENQLNTILQVLEGEPTRPTRLNPRIPPELERICLCCLEKAPAGRYQTAAALADDLERFLRREPIEARAAGFRQMFHRWVRRQPALASHLAGLALIVSIVQVKYWISGYDLAFHLKMMGVLGTWGLASGVLQWLLDRPRTATLARFVWAAADVGLLNVALWLAEQPLGPLLGGYPLIVAASGLWFRERLVWFTTMLAIVSYAGLAILRPNPTEPWHYTLIFGAVLAVLGFTIAYQVRRVRALSQYFEQQRLPGQ